MKAKLEVARGSFLAHIVAHPLFWLANGALQAGLRPSFHVLLHVDRLEGEALVIEIVFTLTRRHLGVRPPGPPSFHVLHCQSEGGK